MGSSGASFADNLTVLRLLLWIHTCPKKKINWNDAVLTNRHFWQLNCCEIFCCNITYLGRFLLKLFIFAYILNIYGDLKDSLTDAFKEFMGERFEQVIFSEFWHGFVQLLYYFYANIPIEIFAKATKKSHTCCLKDFFKKNYVRLQVNCSIFHLNWVRFIYSKIFLCLFMPTHGNFTLKTRCNKWNFVAEKNLELLK